MNGVRALNGTPGSNATGVFLKNNMRCRTYAFINGYNGYVVHFDAYSFSPLLFSSLVLSSVGSPGRITAEPLMYRAAIQLARDASVEELLGNLQTCVDCFRFVSSSITE
jgi:hypothetical protein